MNPELVEKVTKMIVERIQAQQEVESNPAATTVKFWNHAQGTEPSVTARTVVTDTNSIQENNHGKGLVQFRSYTDDTSASSVGEKVSTNQKESSTKAAIDPSHGIDNPLNPEELKDLVSKTPARIGVGRAGLRPKTNTWLKFRFDHAAAVDAVYGDVQENLLTRLELFKVNTLVKDKETYIRRPDLGRKLSEEAKQMIKEKCRKSPTVQIIVSDGLSSSAVDENAEDVFLSLQQSLQSLGLDTGTPFYIEKGRVAVMDDVGELIQPKVVVLLIGERPGLVSAESLSAYLCYMPKKGTIEADRMVISNIHKGGIPPVEAGAYLGTVIQKVLKYEASGVSLVQKES
ncbi:ethanolamine ammonia-lyase subunit EutC [Pseudoneobacillus rhizosphaerae]|uniref:Ethanolamine ammonia-lyase small subunit n=1 Tax=Pseudoneobacillus rhizosphaerae TaxID=2880968 RepID=A0A9C7G7Z0_9BACI|nr:ethanolamine ammonia-lyase subunit EutC [Pseudoneobacillus rhizosphaerae]CAG9607644.1 Ethanolamine ammonia-lyase light chain [Pseudoneobacillus rhizosphaerae]